ncbi:MAG: hypothetical protein KJ769_08380 [Candidatus Margulisbacteria bacterium]|nr:hypothetical protein [Candidatus Margulisiibacteriota bacterium]
MNKLEFFDYIKAIIKEDIYDHLISIWINQAIEQIALQYNFPEMEKYKIIDTSLSINSFPERYKSINYIDNLTSKTRLTEKLKIELDTFEEKRGIPLYYIDNGDLTFSLYPIPDREYRINLSYIEYPKNLINNTDVPTLLKKDNLIIAQAMVIAVSVIPLPHETKLWIGLLKLYTGIVLQNNINKRNWKPEQSCKNRIVNPNTFILEVN